MRACFVCVCVCVDVLCVCVCMCVCARACALASDILEESIHNIKKIRKVLIIASKDTDLDVKAKKTKYMVMSRDHNAGQNNNIKIRNESFEAMEQFKYLGKT